MSPGNTMMRVYATLKARIMSGAFAPGERLDPARLAPELGASRTPVRDALLRLSAERLVVSLQNEGFRQPHIGESAVRDLYLWSNEILHVILRAAARRATHGEDPTGQMLDDYVSATAACFSSISELSTNLEHRHAIFSINDRCATLRFAEAKVLEHAMRDVLAIETAILSGEMIKVGRAVDLFHRRRLNAVAEIAAALRPAPGRGH